MKVSRCLITSRMVNKHYSEESRAWPDLPSKGRVKGVALPLGCKEARHAHAEIVQPG
jgi:hypothetical protein